MNNTPYSDVYNRFLNKIVNDTSFFKKNISAEEAMRISKVRMLYIMETAIKVLMIDTPYDSPSDFTDKDNELEEFNFALTLIEEDLVASSMYVVYVDETTVKLIRELNKLGFSDSEIRVFSPSASLKEFNETYTRLKNGNYDDIKNYKLRDRNTYKKKKYSFNSNGV